MTTEKKKEQTLVMYGTVKDLTVHQIRFDGSYRSKRSVGENIVCTDLDFRLYLTMQTPLCQHC